MNRVSRGMSRKIRSIRASKNASDGDRGGGEEGEKEFEGEVKEKEIISNASWLASRSNEAVVAKVEAIRPQLGDSDFEKPQCTPATLGPGVSPLHGPASKPTLVEVV